MEIHPVVSAKAIIVRSCGWSPLEPRDPLEEIPPSGVVGFAYYVSIPEVEYEAVLAEWPGEAEFHPIDLWGTSVEVVGEHTIHPSDPIIKGILKFAERFATAGSCGE